jgi:NADH:ubiquinone oxidoreductase subunit 6 (subunit J)
MSDPYYPHSKLAKSIFSGYYILFFMYSVIFMTTYPILSILEGKDLLGITVIRVVETNIVWDCISVLLFVAMALVFMQVSTVTRRNMTYALVFITITSFITSAVFITKTYNMYFSDRIFIIVLNVALCVKCITYILDKKAQK